MALRRWKRFADTDYTGYRILSSKKTQESMPSKNWLTEEQQNYQNRSFSHPREKERERHLVLCNSFQLAHTFQWLPLSSDWICTLEASTALPVKQFGIIWKDVFTRVAGLYSMRKYGWSAMFKYKNAHLALPLLECGSWCTDPTSSTKSCLA